MRSTRLTLVPFLLLAACTDQSVSPEAPADPPLALTAQDAGPIAHRVSVGGPDICEVFGETPGCDANFSLVAVQFNDGRVTGQLTDQSGPADGLQAEIDCLLVQVAPGRTTLEAFVGGVVTRPAWQAGQRIIARMRDNGVSANDPLDAISTVFMDFEPTHISSNCQDKPQITFFRMGKGQVTIW